MSKRAEEKAQEYEKSLDYYHYTSDNPSVAYQKGYEQAQKDTIERACKWMKLHTCTFNNMEEVDLYIDLFHKAMEEE